jgi:hypothetical protein
MRELVSAAAAVFTTGHIVLTGVLCGVVAALVAAWWQRGSYRALDSFAIGLLTAAAVVLSRKSANMPQLNNDGLQGFSANDLLAPSVTFVVLGLYAAVRPAQEERRFEQARAAATIVAFAINVITI